MNYIRQVNTFYKFLPNNPLSPNAQCLYMYLLNKNNELGWIKEFTVSNMIVCGFTGIDRRTLDRARNELKQKGYIDYKQGKGNQAGKYLIVQFDTQCDTQCDTQYDTQYGIQMSHNMTTLNKLNINNKEKENIKEKENLISPKGDSSSDDDGVSFSNPANAVSPIGDIPSKEKSMLELAESPNVEPDINISPLVTKKKNKKEKQSADEEALSYNFELIWKSYPRKDGKMEAYRHYKSLIKGKKVLGTTMKFSNDEILDAVLEYAREKEYTDKQYLAQGSTFFNNKIIDYLLKERENSE